MVHNHIYTITSQEKFPVHSPVSVFISTICDKFGKPIYYLISIIHFRYKSLAIVVKLRFHYSFCYNCYMSEHETWLDVALVSSILTCLHNCYGSNKQQKLVGTSTCMDCICWLCLLLNTTNAGWSATLVAMVYNWCFHWSSVRDFKTGGWNTQTYTF